MEPFNTPDKPDCLIEISLRQLDGPKSDPLVVALHELLTRAVREASEEPAVIDEAELFPPDDPEAVAKSRKVEAQLEHRIEQHSATNPERQEEYRALIAKPSGQDELRKRQQAAEQKVREVVARLMRNGVLALESKVTENAEVLK
jgi:fumarylacetoacetate (FAA) hydrolase family protein